MPIIKSAIKRVRQTAKRQTRNRLFKQSLRGATKALHAAVESKDVKRATQELQSVYSHLDKAVKKNLLHKNAAARKKAQFTKFAQGLVGNAAPKKKATPKTTKAGASKKTAPASAAKKTASTAAKPRKVAAKKMAPKKTTKK